MLCSGCISFPSLDENILYDVLLQNAYNAHLSPLSWSLWWVKPSPWHGDSVWSWLPAAQTRIRTQACRFLVRDTNHYTAEARMLAWNKMMINQTKCSFASIRFRMACVDKWNKTTCYQRVRRKESPNWCHRKIKVIINSLFKITTLDIFKQI